MKRIGLVGGLSWVSTVDYYKFINQEINNKLGGLNYTECVIYSLDFGAVQEATWEGSYDLLLKACLCLQKMEVDGIALCANTAHLFADKLASEINLPIIHIGQATAQVVSGKGFKKVGLVGTKFTMELPFYKSKLKQNGLEVIVPKKVSTRNYVQQVVKDELCAGHFKKESKENFIEILNELHARGAEAIILGCTEIPLLVNQDDFEFPVFDTTKIHVDAIVDYILN